MVQDRSIDDPVTIVATSLGLTAASVFKKLLQQEPRLADAIIFLQGDQFDRAPAVVELYKNRFASFILITGNNDLIGRGKRNEENDVHLLQLKEYLLRQGISEEAITIDDQSLNTLEQAFATIKIAKARKWATLLVVTSPFHILRAYLTFLKQSRLQGWEGAIVMHAADLPWEKPPSGRVKAARAMLDIEMDKIKRYASDLATIAEGIMSP